MNFVKTISTMVHLALFSVLLVCTANAQPQTRSIDLQPISTPEVKIIRVVKGQVAGVDSKLTIRVEWGASAPQITELLGFDAFVEVEFADGSKSSGLLSVGGSARQAEVRVPNRAGVQPRNFTASVTTDFKFIDANFVTRTEEFTLEKSNGFQSTGQGSPNQRPSGEVQIGRVREKFEGCEPTKDCFIIDWGAGPLASVTFTQFFIKGDITYVTSPQGDVSRSASATFSGNVRTAQLAVDAVKATGLNKIVVKATIKASATIRKKAASALKGHF